MLISPTKRPQQFGFKQGDSHIVVNAAAETAKAYSFSGVLQWEKPCLSDGQHPNWKANRGDTPPSLYRIGEIYNDIARVGTKPAFDRTLMQFGWLSFDMVDLEGKEDDNGRAGIMLHGGGSACGWPGAWHPYQALHPTLGCLRMRNADLRDFVLPLTRRGVVFISVHQDNK